MTHSFRDHHLLQLLQRYDEHPQPLDLLIRYYFREHKALGSKDRRAVAETAYAMVRWRGLLDYHCGKPHTWEQRLATYRSVDLGALRNKEALPLHIRCSCPKVLFDKLVAQYGEEKAIMLSLVNNTQAPTTIRVNASKVTDREKLLREWKDRYPVSPCAHSPWGIRFHKRTNFAEMAEFRAGLFEVQDEASQLIATLVAAQPKQHVLDYCAGAGGKTLAFAPKMEGTGQIFLYDIRRSALQQARKRLRRAGIQNAQFLDDSAIKGRKLKKRMDWVLVDVPCSGTGTLRRNPDLKWRFDPEMLQRLVEEQRQIFSEALQFCKPTGKIVYSTCSVLHEENEAQAAYFAEKHGLEVVEPLFSTLPTEEGMDGFFGAVLARRSEC